MMFEKPLKYVIATDRARNVRIDVVGAGGTGSQVVANLARLAYEAQREGINVALRVIDPDVVEERNVGRQLFSPAEVGKNKAIAVAERYTAAFGLTIQARPCAVEDVRDGYIVNSPLLITVSCVDSAAARREVLRKVCDGRKRFWIDCGNDADSGQVLIGVGSLGERGSDAKIEVSALGTVSGLPWPHEQVPALFVDGKPAVQPDPLTCMTIAPEQGLFINQAMALHATEYVRKIIYERVLTSMGVRLSLADGVTRPWLITPKNLAARSGDRRPAEVE